jgi:hypothetical protein
LVSSEFRSNLCAKIPLKSQSGCHLLGDLAQDGGRIGGAI